MPFVFDQHWNSRNGRKQILLKLFGSMLVFFLVTVCVTGVLGADTWLVKDLSGTLSFRLFTGRTERENSLQALAVPNTGPGAADFGLPGLVLFHQPTPQRTHGG